MVATLRLKTEMVTKIRGWKGLKTDTALAEAMGIDAGNLSRVLRGELADLFEVVDDEKVPA
jgi:hypothetical protein